MTIENNKKIGTLVKVYRIQRDVINNKESAKVDSLLIFYRDERRSQTM